MATILSEIALFSLVVAIILSLAGIANPQWAQSRQDGARLPYMFRIRSFFLAIAEIIFLSVSILISGTCKLLLIYNCKIAKLTYDHKGTKLRGIQL